MPVLVLWVYCLYFLGAGPPPLQQNRNSNVVAGQGRINKETVYKLYYLKNAARGASARRARAKGGASARRARAKGGASANERLV